MLSDETIHGLESEFQQLIEHEAHLMKDARVIRAQKLKQKEQEEIERRTRIREEMKGKNGTIIMAGNKIKMVGSRIVMAGSRIIMVGSRIIMVGSRIIMVGSRIIMAGSRIIINGGK